MKVRCYSYEECSPRFNLGVSIKHTILAESSPVDDFYRVETCNKDGSICVSYTNPLQVLLNQKRINSIGSMGIEQIKQWLIGSSSSSLQELRKNCSDDELIALIKDKNLQSPAEILAWSKYCSGQMDEFKSNVQAVADKLKQESASQEPSKTE